MSRHVAPNWSRITFGADVYGTSANAACMAASIVHDKAALWLDQWAEGKCASRDMIPTIEKVDGLTRAWLRVVVHTKYAKACRRELAYG